jgi:hypothetical protein
MSEPARHDQGVQIVHGVLQPGLSAKLEARVTADATTTRGGKPDPIWRMGTYSVCGVEGCGDTGDVDQLGPVVGHDHDGERALATAAACDADVDAELCRAVTHLSSSDPD